MEMASSQTSSNQTFSMVHPPPIQYTPSPWFLPIIAFLKVAPFRSRKTVSAWPLRIINLGPLEPYSMGPLLTSFCLLLAGTRPSVKTRILSIIGLARGDLNGL